MRGMMGGGGRSSGGGGSKGRYYQGITQFLKMAWQGGGNCLLLLGENTKDALKCEIFYHDENNCIKSLPAGENLDVKAWFAVAALPKHHPAFNGVDTMTRPYFVGTGNKFGASLQF